MANMVFEKKGQLSLLPPNPEAPPPTLHHLLHGRRLVVTYSLATRQLEVELSLKSSSGGEELRLFLKPTELMVLEAAGLHSQALNNLLTVIK